MERKRERKVESAEHSDPQTFRMSVRMYSETFHLKILIKCVLKIHALGIIYRTFNLHIRLIWAAQYSTQLLLHFQLCQFFFSYYTFILDLFCFFKFLSFYILEENINGFKKCLVKCQLLTQVGRKMIHSSTDAVLIS